MLFIVSSGQMGLQGPFVQNGSQVGLAISFRSHICPIETQRRLSEGIDRHLWSIEVCLVAA